MNVPFVKMLVNSQELGTLIGLDVVPWGGV